MHIGLQGGFNVGVSQPGLYVLHIRTVFNQQCGVGDRSRYGYVRVEFDRELRYCTGEICHSPKELFDLLLSDYQNYMEVELTQGRRELTEDDEKQIRVLCKKYVDRLQEELMK